MLRRKLLELFALIRQIRDEQLQWRLHRQTSAADLRKAQALAEQELAAQLRKQVQQMTHDLAIKQAKNSTELAMVKTQCQQDIKDYQQYLQALDKLKLSLRQSYAHLPEAVAFTIHHHAKQLLNKMWEARGETEKQQIELQLLQFMTAVHEDNQFSLQNDGKLGLPEKTLAIIDENKSFK